MSDRLVPDWLDGFMKYTKNSEPPDSFRKWVGISVIASALQRKCFVDWGMLTFYPNLYIILVGPAATRKGTAMYPGQDLLRKLGVPMAADATTLQALIRRLKEAKGTQINPETGLPIFHSSMTVFSKEFTVFLGYKNDELIASLCDWYDCDAKWKYDTKNAGTDVIDGVWVNMIGGTTPDMIRSSLPIDAIGGGLTSRIIFIVEHSKGKTVPLPFLDDEQLQLQNDLYLDLERISMLVGKFKVTQDFIQHWVDWYTQMEGSPPSIDDHRFHGYIQRKPNHAMKVSMVMSVSRSSEMVLRKRDLIRAIKHLNVAEQRMPEVFAGVGESPVAGILPRVMNFIKIKQVVAYDELMRQFYQDLDDFEMQKLVRTLDKMGYIQLMYRGETPMQITYIGRPTEIN